jgi:hypothetical protein
MRPIILLACLSFAGLIFGSDAQPLAGSAAIHWRQFTGTLGNAKRMIIYLGTPSRSLKDPRPVEPIIMVDDFEFYKEAKQISPESAAKLTALVSDSASFSEYRGMKLCGGFHPDICIEWQFEQDGQEWHQRAFACLSCREWRLLDTQSAVHTDMTKTAADEVTRIFRALRGEIRKKESKQ